MRVTYKWLKEFVDINLSAEALAQKLTMAGLEVTSLTKVEEDVVFDIEITANRPDLLSVLGIAREVSAIIEKPIKLPKEIKDSMSGATHHFGAISRKTVRGTRGAKGKIKIEIKDKRLCQRYVGRIIKDVKVGPSPKWLQERLSMVGLRPINNIVDITNYILIELGQPIHAFDLDKIEGNGIFVRKAKKNESVVSIDGVGRVLDPQILVIADKTKPIAIAGIMGGKDTEIVDRTKDVLLESAYFDPYFIRQGSRKLGLASESSYRFERGVDPGNILAASNRATKLIEKLAKGHPMGGPVDIGELPKKTEKIYFSLYNIPKVLGMEIPIQTQKDILKRLGFSRLLRKKDGLYLNVPLHRRDIKYEIDIVEEIARLNGYDKIPIGAPNFWVQKRYLLENRYLPLENQIRRILNSLGATEVLSFSLVSREGFELIGGIEDSFRIKNPLSLQQEFLRTSLLPEGLELLRFNLNRKNENLRFFELGKVFLKEVPEKGPFQNGAQGFLEMPKLLVGLCGNTPLNWKEKSREYSFFDLKGILEVLFEELKIKEYKFIKGDFAIFKEYLNCQVISAQETLGVAGEVKKEVLNKFDIKKKVFLCELDLEKILKIAILDSEFKSLPRYPSIRRDLALVVDEEVFSSEIIDLIQGIGADLVKSIDVFDLYYGEQIPLGKKGLAFSIEYREDTRTLRDEEISALHTKICDSLVKRLGVEIRG